MNKALQIATAFALSTLGLYLFYVTLGNSLLDKEQMRVAIIDETTLTIGRGTCATEVNLSIWEDLNKLGIVAAVAACEKAEEIDYE